MSTEINDPQIAAFEALSPMLHANDKHLFYAWHRALFLEFEAPVALFLGWLLWESTMQESPSPYNWIPISKQRLLEELQLREWIQKCAILFLKQQGLLEVKQLNRRGGRLGRINFESLHFRILNCRELRADSARSIEKHKNYGRIPPVVLKNIRATRGVKKDSPQEPPLNDPPLDTIPFQSPFLIPPYNPPLNSPTKRKEEEKHIYKKKISISTTKASFFHIKTKYEQEDHWTKAASQLIEVVVKLGKIKQIPNKSIWANHFRSFAKKHPQPKHPQILHTLQLYLGHLQQPDNKWCPKAYTALTFCYKFDKIVAYLENTQTATDARHPTTPLELHPVVKALCYDKENGLLSTLAWPSEAAAQLPKIIQQSYDNLIAMTRILKSINTPEHPKYRLYYSTVEQLHDYTFLNWDVRHFMLQWFTERHSQLMSWKAWRGNLNMEKEIIHPAASNLRGVFESASLATHGDHRIGTSLVAFVKASFAS